MILLLLFVRRKRRRSLVVVQSLYIPTGTVRVPGTCTGNVPCTGIWYEHFFLCCCLLLPPTADRRPLCFASFPFQILSARARLTAACLPARAAPAAKTRFDQSDQEGVVISPVSVSCVTE